MNNGRFQPTALHAAAEARAVGRLCREEVCMPYNIYDNRGNKVGTATSAGEEIAGAVVFTLLLIYGLPGIIAIILIGAGIAALVNVYWPWAQELHHLTEYPNLNGIITTLAILFASFLVFIRWDKIRDRDASILEELGIVVGLTCLGITASSGLVSILKAHHVTPWLLGGTIGVMLRRYEIVQKIAKGILYIIATILAIGIVLALLAAIFIPIIKWLFSH